MKKKVWGIALASLLVPAAAFAQATTPQTFGDLANMIVQIFDSATFDLIILAIVVYFWGVSSSLFKGQEGRQHLRSQLVWGVVVIFMAVSVWGLVTILQNTFFGSDVGGGSSGGSSGQLCSGFGTCSFE